MTKEQEMLKVEIAAIKEQVRRAEIRLGQLTKRCTHLIEESPAHAAVCSICGSRFGWWCPKSPDHACHYHTEDGHKMVRLIDGRSAELADDTEGQESDDWCLFCGDPEERK